MQIITDIGLVVIVSLAASFLLMAKLHEQLSGLIEGHLYREHSQKLPKGVRAKYRASQREWILHVVSFVLLGVAIGLLVYHEQLKLPSFVVSAFALGAFFLLTKEIKRNFSVEEERNRAIFADQKRR